MNIGFNTLIPKIRLVIEKLLNFLVASLLVPIITKFNFHLYTLVLTHNLWKFDEDISFHTCSNYIKNTQKIQLNRRNFYNLQSHLACSYNRMYTLIRHTTCKSLVNIQYFRRDRLTIMYENLIRRRSTFYSYTFQTG